MFDFAKAIANRPSDAQLPAQSGIFHYSEGANGAVIPDPAWAKQHIVTVDVSHLADFPRTPGGAVVHHVEIHRDVADWFLATMEEAQRRDVLKYLRTWDGLWVPRHMGHDPHRPLSVHSWGKAFDVNARWNGYGVAYPQMELNHDLVCCFEECGLTWGGRWTGVYADGMHAQFTDPLPGTNVQPWQDAMGKAASKPVPAAVRRTVTVDGRPLTGRQALRGVTLAVQPDGSLWARPSTPSEAAGTLAPSAPVTGISQRVTLQQPDNSWLPFTGGTTAYGGLHLTLDAATGNVTITS